MTTRIVAGYNASASSTEAVQWAATEAIARHAPLHLISCYEIPVMTETGGAWLATDVIDSLISGTSNSLGEMQAVLAEQHPDLDVTTEVSAGPAQSVLVHDLHTTDLLVLGTSSHEGAAGFWLGNTARSAMRHSPCPVAVVRGAASRGRPDRVVVGVDGSDASAAALRWAADEADLHGSPLVVVHGWHDDYVGVDSHAAQTRDLINIDAGCVLDGAVEVARERCGVDVEGVLVEASPVWALLETVRDGDVLVLGSRGRGAVATSLFGSTVNSVVDQAAVPVVVVRG